MVPEQLAVIGTEDHQAVVEHAGFLQSIQHLPQLLVHRGHLGVVMPPHLGDGLFGGGVHIDDGLVLRLRQRTLVRLLLRGFVRQLPLSKGARRHRAVAVHLQVAGHWVPGRVRTGKADLQKDRTLMPVLIYPPQGGVADEEVAAMRAANGGQVRESGRERC